METEKLDPENITATVVSAGAKPGYQTTEFWLTLLATLIGALLASGVLNDADPQQHKVLQLVGVIATLLGSMGYTAARAFTKHSEAKASAIVAAAGAAAKADPS